MGIKKQLSMQIKLDAAGAQAKAIKVIESSYIINHQSGGRQDVK